jgi:hypothetical protein
MARGDDDDVAETIRERLLAPVAKAGRGMGEDTPSLTDKAKTRATRKINSIAGTTPSTRVGEESCFYAVVGTPFTILHFE